MMTMGACTLGMEALAIDLTPRYVTTYAEGIAVRRPYFFHGDRKYALRVGSDVELLPGDHAAIFNFKGFPRAVMLLRPSPIKASVPFDTTNLVAYREAAARFLEEGAIKPALVSEDTDVLPVNRWRSQRMTFDYEFAGMRTRACIIFLNLHPAEQIIVQIRADRADFNAVSTRALSIMRRWHEVTPDSETGEN